MDCLFCKIIAGEIPSKKVYEDEAVYAFYDIQPQAPTHVLIVPRAHIASAQEITAENADAVRAIFEAIPRIAEALGLANGYRVVTNCGYFQSSLETASLLKELGAELVVARASRGVQAKFLLRNGADEVVYPEKQLAKWTAIRYTADHILDYIQLDDSHSIFEVTIPEKWIGYKVGEIDIRKKYNINILATKQNGIMNLSVTPDTLLTQDKTMLVLGEFKDLQRCFHI